MILTTIVLMAIKVISVVGRGALGQLATEWNDILFTPLGVTSIGIGGGTLGILWVALLLYLAKRAEDWEKRWVKTLMIGCLFMGGFFVVLAVVGISVFTLDGFAGEIAGKIAGYLSSPILMELSFCAIGLFLLVSFLMLKRFIEGDEFVEIEVKEE